MKKTLVVNGYEVATKVWSIEEVRAINADPTMVLVEPK